MVYGAHSVPEEWGSINLLTPFSSHCPDTLFDVTLPCLAPVAGQEQDRVFPANSKAPGVGWRRKGEENSTIPVALLAASHLSSSDKIH